MAMPDHLGKFIRPAPLLPWKRVIWGAWPRAVPQVPLMPDDYRALAYRPVVPEHWELAPAVCEEFLWDGTYPSE